MLPKSHGHQGKSTSQSVSWIPLMKKSSLRIPLSCHLRMTLMVPPLTLFLPDHCMTIMMMDSDSEDGTMMVMTAGMKVMTTLMMSVRMGVLAMEMGEEAVKGVMVGWWWQTRTSLAAWHSWHPSHLEGLWYPANSSWCCYRPCHCNDYERWFLA
jgi:hypothetical protein